MPTHDKAKIWFFTDLHGSNECFRKFLNAFKNANRPNVLIVGGDITGKQLVPIIEDARGSIFTPIGSTQIRHPRSEIPNLKIRLADRGYYPYECDEATYRLLQIDNATFRKVFDRLVADRLRDWVSLADSRLPSRDVCQVFVNAGNDDPLFVDAILDKSATLVRPEGKIVDLPCNLRLLSTGYCNKTPWDCPRDLTEEALKVKIAGLIRTLIETGGSPDKAIFNLHCPPKNTALDIADEIDHRTLKKIAGVKGARKAHVGSTTVREAIETCQPLAGLHGHIHHVHAIDWIGKSPCCNPGSDYQSGLLQGVYLQVDRLGALEATTPLLTRERDAREERQPRALSLFHLIPWLGEILLSHEVRSGNERTHRQLDRLSKEVGYLRGKIGIDADVRLAGKSDDTPNGVDNGDPH